MSIADDYFNALNVFLQEFPDTPGQIYELVDQRGCNWHLTDDAVFFDDDDRARDDDHDFIYSEDLALCGVNRGKDFTLVSIHNCMGIDETLVFDNHLEFK